MTRLLLLISCAAAMTFVAATAPAQTVAQSDDATSDASKDTIAGHVVDQNGQPLANALVNARSYGSTSRGGTATTDRDGNFQISGLDPFAYIVSASLPAYIPVPRDPDATPLPFYRIGESAQLQLIKGGVITGNVKKANGDPVVSVIVRAYMIRDNKGQPPRYGVPVRSRQTDDRGIYRIYGLPPGAYIVSAGGMGNASGYNVDAYGSDVPTYAPSSPRDAAAEVSLSGGEEVSNIDIRYREEPGHTISGAASGGVPEQGFSVLLTSMASGALQASHNFFQPPGVRGFALSGVPDGDYDLIAQQSSSTNLIVSEPRRIQVRGADISGVELIAKPLASIAGSVVMEISKLPECEGKRKPLLSETVIGPWHNEKTIPKDQPQFLFAMGGPTIPGKDGNFSLRNLAPGQYRFSVRPMAKYWYLKSITWPTVATTSPKAPLPDRPRDAARNWTTVRRGEQLTGLTITFAEGAASLRGQIDAGEGKKLPPRIFVYLAPAEADKAEDILRYCVVLAAQDGTFTLTNLPPGRYSATAAPAGDDDSNMLSKLRLPEETELRAKLRRDGQTAQTFAELKPCQNFTEYHLPFKLNQ